jgi:hypothetical protein
MAQARGRKVLIYEQFLQGTKSQRQIATEFSLTPGRICQIIHEMDADVLEQLREKRSALKARQHGQLEHIAREAMRAWQESKQPVQPSTTTSNRRNRRTVNNRCGDPRYLDQALKALDGIRRIWGLETLSSRPALSPDDQASQTTNIINQLQVYLSDDRTRDALGTLAAQLPALEQDRHPGAFGGDHIPGPVEDDQASGATQPEAD